MSDDTLLSDLAFVIGVNGDVHPQANLSMAKRTLAEIARLRAALAKLVGKLTAIEADPSFRGIWSYLHVHGYKYTGPDWRDDLADARLALSPPPQEAER